MKEYLLKTLNIRSNEAAHVYTLLKIKFVLGLATSFLVVGSMTLFLSTNSPHQLPSIYLLVALLLLPINYIYNYLDHHYKPVSVLLIITAFCSISTAILLATNYILKDSDLAFLITAWNVILYMLVGYAFWGLSSTIFNVRESRRLFAIIGAGDIPSKLLGYLASSLIIPIIGAFYFLEISVILFAFCYAYFIYIKSEIPKSEIHEVHAVLEEKHKNFLLDIFGNKLILYISLLSFIAYLVYLFIDYTFLSEIKERFHSEKDLATFISLFFAGGRILAFIFKMIFSSRVISNLGLSKSLMLTPAISFFMCLSILSLYGLGENPHAFLYLFGLMAIVSEILRSVIQEPVFFILFQPLSIHTRLKGHLVAKGYIFPIALLLSGVFLKLILKDDSPLSIPFIVAVIIIHLVLWMMVIPLIRREYFSAVSRSIQSGFFKGQSMFLEDGGAQSVLLDKIITGKPIEIIYALDMLERSGFSDYDAVLGQTFKNNTDPQLLTFILDNIRKKKTTHLLPYLKQAFPNLKTEQLKQLTLRTILSLKPSEVDNYKYILDEPIDSSTAEILISMIRSGGSSKAEAIDIMEKRVDSYFFEARMLTANVLDKELIEPQGIEMLKKLLVDEDNRIVIKAVKIACKHKQFDLIDTVINAYVQNPQHKNAFVQAMSMYGDDFFKNHAKQLTAKRPELVDFLIEIATKIEGTHSLKFLLNSFANKDADNGKLIHIFYEQRYVPTPEKLPLFESLLDDYMSEIMDKYILLNDWTVAQGDVRIQSAIYEEVKYQFRECIELSGILYGHQHTKRILHIFDMENDYRQSNALELMELIIPKKHFANLEKIWEGILSFNKNKTQTGAITAAQKPILMTILSNGRAFKSWTKSIVLYVVSQFPDTFSAEVLEKNPSLVLHPIEAETRAHLMNIINKK